MKASSAEARAEQAESRLVSVLCAVPESVSPDLAARLAALGEAASRLGGMVDAADGGLTAVFGAVRASESDPERAVLAALEVARTARLDGLSLGIGVATGEALVTLPEAGAPAHPHVAGSVVEEARALGRTAALDEVRIADETWRQVRRAFQCTERETRQAAGGTRVSGRAVERPLPRREKVRGLEGQHAPLVGRDAELAALQAALADAVAGRGRAVAVVGDAGLGKTRLARELSQRHLHGDWLLWLEGRCHEVEVATAYRPFLDLLRGCFAGPAGEPEEKRSLRIREELAELLDRPEESAPAHDPVVTLASLLGLPLSDDEAQALAGISAEQVRRQTFSAIRQALFALAKRQPVVVVLDDFHWADSLSRQLAALLLEGLARHRLLLLFLLRPGPTSPAEELAVAAARRCPGGYREIALSELSHDAGRALVDALLDLADVPPGTKETILERSQGNPFYVEEMLRALTDAGRLYRDGRFWRLQGEMTPDLPLPVHSVIQSRIDRLPPRHRELLQVASVMGRVFHPEVVEQLGPTPTSLSRSLRELERLQLVVQEPGYPRAGGAAAGRAAGEEYAFRHVLIRDTVYRSLPDGRRAALHRQVAEALESLHRGRTAEVCEELARHYSAAGERERAATYLLRAGQKARRQYANQEARAHLEAALQLLDAAPDADPEMRARVLDELGEVLFRLGAHVDAERRLREALDAADRDETRRVAALYWRLADALHWQQRHDLSIASAEAGLAALGEDRHSAEALNLLEVIMRSCWARNDLLSARRYGEQIQALLPHVPYYDSIYMVLYALAWLEVRSRDYSAAERWLRVMERVCRQHGNENGLARCYHGRGDMDRARQEYDRAYEWFDRSLEYCERTGDAHLLMEGHLESAHLLVLLDRDPARLEAHIQRGLDLAEEMARAGSVSSVQVLCEMLGRAYESRGRPETALRYFRKAFEFGPHPTPAAALKSLEKLYREQGRHATFERFCEEHQPPPHAAPELSLRHWRLTPAPADPGLSEPVFTDGFAGGRLRDGWTWVDPEGDSLFADVPGGGGLELHTGPGRSLSADRSNAPRLLLAAPQPGDFAAEACLARPETSGECHMGGLLLWLGPADYFFLGQIDPLDREVGAGQCREGRFALIGRGWLPPGPLHLRLERRGDRVRALCSPDGRRWQLCAEARFTAGPAQVGLFVACPPAGTRSRAHFRDFRLLRE